MTQNIKKLPATIEDLAVGIGQVQQDRAGTTVVLHKINVPIAFNNTADMADIDVTKYTYARVFDGQRYTDFVYDADPGSGGIPSTTGPGTWITQTGTILFNTVADMVAADLAQGTICRTLGYASLGDNGRAQYFIGPAGGANGYFNHATSNGNDAYIFLEEEMRAEVSGIAAGNTAAQNTAALSEFIGTRVNIVFGAGVYLLNVIDLNAQVDPARLRGEGADLSILRQDPGSTGSFLTAVGVLGNEVKDLHIADIRLEGSVGNTNEVVYLQNVSGDHSQFDHVNIVVNNLNCDGVVASSCWDIDFDQMNITGIYTDGAVGTGRGFVAFGEAGQGVAQHVTAHNIKVSYMPYGIQIGKVTEAGAGITQAMTLTACQAFNCGTGYDFGDCFNTVHTNCTALTCWNSGFRHGFAAGKVPVGLTSISQQADNCQRSADVTVGDVIIDGGRGYNFINPHCGRSDRGFYINPILNQLGAVRLSLPRFTPLVSGSGSPFVLGNVGTNVMVDRVVYDGLYNIAANQNIVWMDSFGAAVTLVDDGTIPTVPVGCHTLTIENSAPTNILDLQDGYGFGLTTYFWADGHRIHIVFSDANSTVIHGFTQGNGNFRLEGGVNWNPGKGSALVIERRDGLWYEVSRNTTTLP